MARRQVGGKMGLNENLFNPCAGLWLGRGLASG